MSYSLSTGSYSSTSSVHNSFSIMHFRLGYLLKCLDYPEPFMQIFEIDDILHRCALFIGNNEKREEMDSGCEGYTVDNLTICGMRAGYFADKCVQLMSDLIKAQKRGETHCRFV